MNGVVTIHQKKGTGAIHSNPGADSRLSRGRFKGELLKQEILSRVSE
jgi:hypothetical protein